MTGVAAFANVDVAARELERGVDPHARRILDGLMDCEQRDDLNCAADTGCAHDGQQQADRLALKPVMQVEHARSLPRLKRGDSTKRWYRTIGSPFVGRLVRRLDGHPDVIASDQRAD